MAETSPVKAIRKFCLECVGDSFVEVEKCTAPACPLFAFRFGKNPYHSRTTEARKDRAGVGDAQSAKPHRRAEVDH